MYFVDEIIKGHDTDKNKSPTYIIKWLGYPYADSEIITEKEFKKMKNYDELNKLFDKTKDISYTYCFAKYGNYYYSTRITKNKNKVIDTYLYDFWQHNYTWKLEKKQIKNKFNYSCKNNMKKIKEICVLESDFKNKKPKPTYYNSKDYCITFDIIEDGDHCLPEVTIIDKKAEVDDSSNERKYYISQVVINGNFGNFDQSEENMYDLIKEQSRNELNNGHA